MPSRDRWRSKVEALARLAADQRGKPEGDLARTKLVSIISKHPELIRVTAVQELAWQDIALGDLGAMKAAGISLEGSWTGRTPEEAYRMMAEDYVRRRMAQSADDWLRNEIYRVFNVPPDFFNAGESVFGSFVRGMAEREDFEMMGMKVHFTEAVPYGEVHFYGVRSQPTRSSLKEYLRWQEEYTRRCHDAEDT